MARAMPTRCGRNQVPPVSGIRPSLLNACRKAAEWGLIWQCVDDDDFAATIDDLAARLAKMPTKALVRTRQAMHAAPGHTLEQQLSFEGGFMRELGWSPDYAEGVKAFTEKRAPNFTGD